VADAFDVLMNNTCSILRRKSGTDRYNQPNTEFEPQEENVPCRVSILSRYAKREFEIQAGVSYKIVYMRPRAVDVHNMIQLADGTLYEVLDVNDPSLAGHHLEIAVKEVIA